MAPKKDGIQTTKLGNKTRKKKPSAAKEASGANIVLNSEGEPIGKRETASFIIGLLLLVLSLLMLLSFISHLNSGGMDQKLVQEGAWEGYSNLIGALGAYNAWFWMDRCFGLAAFFIPFFLFMTSMKLVQAYKVRLWKWFIHSAILMYWLSISAAFFLTAQFAEWKSISYISPGGQHGQNIVERLSQVMGKPGVGILLLITLLIYLVYVTRETIIVVRKMLNPVDFIRSKMPERKSEPTEDTPTDDTPLPPFCEEPQEPAEPHEEETAQEIDFDLNTPTDTEEEVEPEVIEPEEETEEETPHPADEIDLILEDTVEEDVASETGTGTLEPYDPKLDLENYQYPTLQLLNKYDTDGTAPIDMDEQNANKTQIIDVLKTFGVEISSIKATVGPTITLYEITPSPGVRISKIRNLEDDIALSLRALGIRIIAPIPGKGTIGIEVPNAKPQMVSMESILNSRKFQETTFELPIAFGKTITNEVFMVDLAKMPHLLVAGATGQGKSVGLNAIITSLLYKKHPAELKFVMIDPKKVEFSIYAPIENHFLAKVADTDGEPIITDVTKVIQTLKSLCSEMDTRYDLLRRARARNIIEYNAKFKSRHLNPENGHRFMPYIVVIIDEFGDLIMTAGKEIELPIARIAQLARAVGIHMIIATQRPTTNIITGTIKANFPARMAFKVSAMIDSRTILDRPGANQLIGRGDMLFSSGTEPIRMQCAFVDTPEVERITSYVAKQQSYLGPFELPRVEMEGVDDDGVGAVDMTHLDPAFEDAARLIVASQQGSTSMIQRKFAIGYNRAGRLMDQLEKAGIVGPAQGSKPREVLCMDEMELENKLNNLR